jgi:hypothetical protein
MKRETIPNHPQYGELYPDIERNDQLRDRDLDRDGVYERELAEREDDRPLSSFAFGSFTLLLRLRLGDGSRRLLLELFFGTEGDLLRELE